MNLSIKQLEKIQSNLKTIWLPKKEKEAEIIVYNLVNLKQVLQNSIRQFMEKVNQSLLIIDDMIQQTQIQLESLKMNIDEVEIKELKNLNELKESITTILSQYNTIQSNELNDLQKIWQVNLLETFERKMKQIKLGDSKCGFDQYFNLSFKMENTNVWICNKHYEQINYVNLEENAITQNRLACNKCLQQNQQFKKLEELELLWESNARFIFGKFNNHQNNLFLNWKTIFQLIDEFNKIVYASSNLKNDILKQQFQLMQKDWPSLSQEELNDIACNYNHQQNKLVYDQIELESIAKENKIQQLIIQLKQFLENLNLQVIKSNSNSNKNSMVNQNSYQSLYQQNELSNYKPQSKFELYNYIKQDRCFSFAFSSDSSVLVVGQNRMIKVFEFKDGNLKEKQQLTEHKDYVRCLYFMKKTLQFVSGCNDNLIIIWSWDDQRCWWTHRLYKRRINNEQQKDLIISGSDDFTIRFWIKQNNEWRLHQTLMDHKKEVKSISLNDSQNQLVSCSFGKEIMITEYKSNEKLWITIQKIQVENNGYSLCFISDSLFTFQPQEEEIMHIYELDKLTHQFIKSKSIKIKSGDNRCDFFPQQFNKEKQILLHKNGRTINIIKIIDYREFIPFQYIENFDNYLYGAMTNDAQYLVTWDNQDKEIKIRKFKE